jgi:Ras of Complex, Roc, domain of DAPkinase
VDANNGQTVDYRSDGTPLSPTDSDYNQATWYIHRTYEERSSELHFSCRRLRTIPGTLAMLAPFLTSLAVFRGEVEADAEMAEALALLTKLTRLDLSGNRLEADAQLARALVPLKMLVKLDLGENRIEANAHLARALGPLTNLTELRLASNRLESNPELVQALIPLANLKRLDLRGNSRLGLPPELLEPDNPRRIIRAIVEKAEGLTRSAPEFKVVILGEGRIGKTQLRHRLMGEPVTRDEPETQSFEWQVLPERVIKPGQAEPGVLHLFDFGGQRALLASHRFFLSHRRTIYVLCAPWTWTVGDTRLEHWLRFVQDLREQAARSRAAALWDERNEETRARGEVRFSEVLEQALASTPCPPIVVVLTHADSARRMLDEVRVRALCERYGARLVSDFDSFPESHSTLAERVDRVRGAIHDAARTPALDEVWTEQYSTIGLNRRKRIKTQLGFDPAGLNADPPVKYLTVSEYLRRFCEIDPAKVRTHDKVRVAAIDQLAMLRDLGIVHWLGERRDLGDVSARFRELVFSPAWVRGPVYRVLWSEDTADKPLSRVRLEGLVRSAEPALTEDECGDVISLMVGCELAFELTDEHGLKRYLVPDRLPLGTDLLIKTGTPANSMETLLEADLGFVPDMLMPSLIGHLWSVQRCESMTRCSCTVYWQLNGQTVPVRLCADQGSGVLRCGVTADSGGVESIKMLLEDKISRLLKRHEDKVHLKVVAGRPETVDFANEAPKQPPAREVVQGGVNDALDGVADGVVLDEIAHRLAGIERAVKRPAGQFTASAPRLAPPEPRLGKTDRDRLDAIVRFLRNRLGREWKSSFAVAMEDAFLATTKDHFDRKARMQPQYFRLIRTLVIAEGEPDDRDRVPRTNEIGDLLLDQKGEFKMIVHTLWQMLTGQERLLGSISAIRKGYDKAWIWVHRTDVRDPRSSANIERPEDR